MIVLSFSSSPRNLTLQRKRYISFFSLSLSIRFQCIYILYFHLRFVCVCLVLFLYVFAKLLPVNFPPKKQNHPNDVTNFVLCLLCVSVSVCLCMMVRSMCVNHKTTAKGGRRETRGGQTEGGQGGEGTEVRGAAGHTGLRASRTGEVREARVRQDRQAEGKFLEFVICRVLNMNNSIYMLKFLKLYRFCDIVTVVTNYLAMHTFPHFLDTTNCGRSVVHATRSTNTHTHTNIYPQQTDARKALFGAPLGRVRTSFTRLGAALTNGQQLRAAQRVAML